MLAFLDTNTVRKPDGSLKITIYQKAIHTDQYLDFTYNHPLEHKLSMVRTLHHRTRMVISVEEDRALEVAHVNRARRQCRYSDWAVERSVAPPKKKGSTWERARLRE